MMLREAGEVVGYDADAEGGRGGCVGVMLRESREAVWK